MCKSEQPGNKQVSNAPFKKVEITLMDSTTRSEITKVKVNHWTTQLKEIVHKKWGYPPKQQMLSYKHVWLSSNLELCQYGILDDKAHKCIISVHPRSEDAKKKPHIEVLGDCIPKDMKPVIDGVTQGLNAGIVPELTFEGTSGTYFLKNAKRKPMAVFKPIDEEANAPNNPRGFTGNFGMPSLRNGVLSGEACVREIAAYLVDKDGFSGVPETLLVAITHPSFHYVGEMTDGLTKVNSSHLEEIATMIMIEPPENRTLEARESINIKYGSLQRFAISHDVAENLCEDLFSDDEVHKIAILDLRILNKDRHASNILVHKTKIPADKTATDKKKKEDKIHYTLIPIDHGMSIPDFLDILEMEYCWLSWAHKDRPFSQKTLNYIKSINIMEDIEMLNSQYKFRSICLRNMRLSGTILKKGAAAGLTLGEIGKIWCRTDDEGEVPSIFEEIVKKARSMADFKHEMNENKLYRPLLSRTKIGLNGKKSHPGFVSADMDTYERIKAMEIKYNGDERKVPEKRGRANTMLEDEVDTATLKQKPLVEDGLTVVKESVIEEEKGYLNGKQMEKVGSPDLESTQEEEKCPFGKNVEPLVEKAKGEDSVEIAMPMFSRTLSIPSKLSRRDAKSPGKKKLKLKVSTSTDKKNWGSVRDTPYDTLFFFYFEQYLDTEIKKQIAAREDNDI